MFRDRELAKRLTQGIHALKPSRPIKICHICGTHEWTITHNGIRALLPENVSLIAGPGCPVCIVPAKEIDEAIWLSQNGVTVLTFGDMYRAPGSDISLEDAKSRGGQVRIVYGVRDAIQIAINNPENEFVFFAIGFETTTPMNAVEAERCPDNFSFLVSHRLIPPALDALVGMDDLRLDGFIAPGHVSTVIGMKAYEKYPRMGMPTVVAGFEPLDVLMGVYMILKQIKNGEPRLENEYTRAVSYEGNIKAQEAIARVFDTVDGAWRGLGIIPESALKLREEFSTQDSRKRYEINVGPGRDVYPGCSCPQVILGKISPDKCSLFMTACTPDKPKGACMVSREGTCRIWSIEALL
jgi:hydrogenase expression/formation protein HypD